MSNKCITVYRLYNTTKRLTFDIIWQDSETIYTSNRYGVISRSHMDIQTERIWLHGTKYLEESHSGTMVFSSNEKRDATFDAFNLALSEWAKSWSGYVVGKFNYD